MLLKYRINSGDWQTVEVTVNEDFNINVSAGDKLELIRVDPGSAYKFSWQSTCRYNASGNPNSFAVGENFSKASEPVSLIGMFRRQPVVDASNLVFPEQTFGSYSSMFAGCTNLTQVPELPKKDLSDANSCYSDMFSGCTSLVNAPKLPATTLSDGCYSGMFRGCTSLTTAPKLPAATLSKNCYSSMFSGCTSLVNAPKLPATTLSSGCYSSMFYGCTSLVKAPALPATTLPPSCYSYMFSNSGVKEAPAIDVQTILSDVEYSYARSSCCYHMFYECTALTSADKINIAATEITDYAFYGMFYGCTSLVKVMDTVGANAVTASGQAFDSMFEGCASLVNGPSVVCNSETVFSYGSSDYYTPCQNMFYGCASLVKAPRLPSLHLCNSCYRFMFSNCTSLITAPELPATELKDGCYRSMFKGCTSLVNAPVLHVTSISGDSCYREMFADCTSLVNAPELPATSVTRGCYYGMFSGCTAMVNGPSALPALTLPTQYSYIGGSYGYMFKGCTSLVNAPEIKLTEIKAYDCNYMFSGCTSLSRIVCLAVTRPTSGTLGTSNWVAGVASSGTFVKARGSSWTANVNGVPIGWTSIYVDEQ